MKRIQDKSVQSNNDIDQKKVESNLQDRGNNIVRDNSNTIDKIDNTQITSNEGQKDNQDNNNNEQHKQDQLSQNRNEQSKLNQEQQNLDGLNRSQVINNSHYYSYTTGKRENKKQQQQQQQWTFNNNNNNNNSSFHNMSMKLLNESQYSKFDSASYITRAYEKDVPRSKIDMLKELNAEGYASKKSNQIKKQLSKTKPNIQYNSSPFGSAVEEILKNQAEIVQATEKLLVEYLDKKDALKSNEGDKNISESDKGIQELTEELNRIYKIDEVRSGQNSKILGLAK